MASNIGNVKVRKIDGLVINVLLTKELKIRTFIAIQLIRLSAVILGGRSEIDIDITNDR